jgi:transcriptional regulator with AAA-type ATPase domain/pSer/pThr/pTyr-binding forkhead associated (FHA) protein
MRYLLYFKDGTARKYPLTKEAATIGRGRKNDICLPDAKISKSHCRVTVAPDAITVYDLKSRNGTFVCGQRVQSASVPFNGSFGVGDTEFFFRQGDPREFTVSVELSDVISLYARRKRPSLDDEPATMEAERPFARLLLAITSLVFDGVDSDEFLPALSALLGPSLTGSSLLCQLGSQYHPLVDELRLVDDPAGPHRQTGQPASGIWRRARQPVRYRLFASPHAGGCRLWWFHVREDGRQDEPPDQCDFLTKLAELIDIQMRLAPDLSFDPQPIPTLFDDGDLVIVGQSVAMRKTVALARKIAPHSSFVLILGESGTGKELIAQLLHRLSGRRTYVALNCSAIPANLLESELFGYESGAFTDARRRKIGKIEEASGGTLVLDEIGDMPLEIQAKLLRVIQEKKISRLGGSQPIDVDLRIVAMTNRDLYRLVEAGQFRSDLFYRLRVHELMVPPLRERPEDIPPLIQHFTRLYAQRAKTTPGGFSQSAHACFMAYSWPGNIRELENEIARILEIIDDGELISDHHILPAIRARCPAEAAAPTPAAPDTLPQRLQAVEMAEIQQLLQAHGGNKSAVARALGMSYRGFLKKLRRLSHS